MGEGLRPGLPFRVCLDGGPLLCRDGVQIASVSLVDAVLAGLLLLRIAVHEGLLKLIKQARIEDGDLLVPGAHRALARLEEALDFRGRKALPAWGGEVE